MTYSSIRLIHRHGDRSATRTYPNDPHINHTWPGGKGLGLISQDTSCPKYDDIRAEFETNPPPETQPLYGKNAELYTYLSEHSGLVSSTYELMIIKDWTKR